MEFVKKYIIIIISAITLLALFLPFAQIVSDSCDSELDKEQNLALSVIQSAVEDSEEDGNTVLTEYVEYTGFISIRASVFTLLMILCPVLMEIFELDLLNIDFLAKNKKAISLIIPAAGIVSTILSIILTLIRLSGPAMLLVGSDDSYKAVISIGSIIVLVGFIATLVAALVKYHDVTLDKNGLEKVNTMAKNKKFD